MPTLTIFQLYRGVNKCCKDYGKEKEEQKH